MEKNARKKQIDLGWQPFILVFLFLFCVYLLTYSGVPISDDEHLFASVAQNLALTGEFRADQLLGNQRVLGQYGNVGPLHPLIGSLLVRSIWWTNKLGAVQILYFLSPLYTALTGALIYAYGVIRSYSKKASLISALVFGLSTIVWPYSQTFYREPLAMLLLFGAYLVLTAILDGLIPQKHLVPAWVLCGSLFFLSLLVKIFIVLFLPFLCIRIWNSRQKSIHISFWRTTLALIILGVLIGIVWIGLDLTQSSRLTSLLDAISIERLPQRYQHFFSFETIKNLCGVFFSPAKGLLIYSPVLFVPVISLFSKKARLKENLLLPLAAAFVIMLAQLFFYEEEWWNISWGTRFLLPVIPLLLTAGLPIIESAVEEGNRFFRKVLASSFGLGFFIQLGGTAISDSVYLNYLYTKEGIASVSEIIWNWRLMPGLWHWKLAFTGLDLRYAAVRNFPYSPFLVMGMILVLSVLIWWSGKSLLLSISDVGQKGWYLDKKITAWAVGYTVLLVPVILMVAYRSDPSYFPSLRNPPSAVDILEHKAVQEDVFIIDAYQEPIWYYLINFGRLPAPWYSLPTQTENWGAAFEEIIQREKAVDGIWYLFSGVEEDARIVIKYINGFGYRCVEEPLIESNNISIYTIMSCESGEN